MEACKYIALTSTEQECRIGRVTPVRRHTTGGRPGISGEDPLGPEPGSQDQCKFPNLRRYPITAVEKKMIHKGTILDVVMENVVLGLKLAVIIMVSWII